MNGCVDRIGRGQRRASEWRRAGLAVVAGVAWVLMGCAEWGYDRIRLGMTQHECRQALLEDAWQPTEVGFCAIQAHRDGRTDVLVVMLTGDQRVAGKLHAAHTEGRAPAQAGVRFRLRGELDPAMAGLVGTGPLDALRVVAADLSGCRGAKVARDAHAWVAAGLVRLAERWPHVDRAGLEHPELADVLARVPGGGTARITIERRGVYTFEYVLDPAP